MGFIYFQPSQSRSAPEIQQMTPTSSATIAIGEPVQRNATDDELIEAHTGSTTVTGIVGVALGVVTAGTPAFGSTIPVAIASSEVLFLGQIYDVSASALATAAAGTHEGNSYGFVEPTAGEWYVDEEDTTDIVLQVQKIFTGLNAVLFRFLASAIAAA
jgi:hypothetical protein